MVRAHRIAFRGAVTAASRILIARDRLLGRTHRVAEEHSAQAIFTRHTIAGTGHRLDAVLALPAAGTPRTVLLICHGIGETVEHWPPVQRLLAANGTASLVFDYSGYGRSTGRVDAEQCERDAMAAFAYLRGLMPAHPVAMLGFSLGTGIAASVAQRVAASHLVLCAGFPSFRAAARALGVPAFLERLVPPIWRAAETLQGCSLPVLVVHGERDPLFPVRLAAELHACCGPHAKLIIVPELSHAQPYYRPELRYWGPILAWLESQPGALPKTGD